MWAEGRRRGSGGLQRAGRLYTSANIAVGLTIHSSRSRFAARLNSGVRPSLEINVVEQYLADEHEADEAADYYMTRFAKEGSAVGQPIDLVVEVSGIPAAKLARVEQAVRTRYSCLRVEHRSGGLLRKPSLRAFLLPMPFDRPHMLASATSLYRLILDEDVAVKIERA